VIVKIVEFENMKNEKQHIENELSEIAPFLANLKKDNDSLEAFELPDNYFDNLSDKIFEKTILQAETIPNVTTKDITSSIVWATVSPYFQRLLRPGFAIITTSIVIVAVISTYLINQSTENNMIELTSTEIEAYIENNIEAFEEEQLANLLMTTEKTAVLTNIEDIETDILEEYIEENFIEDVAIDELL